MSGISRLIAATERSPIPEAYSWLEGREFPADKPLLNLSQAAPSDPPPLAMREAMAEAILNEADSHLYGPVLGDGALRAEVAGRWSREHGGMVKGDQVAITSGCNQAFVAAITTLAAAGDEVILPTPWYFNHKMWLDMADIRAIPLPTGAGLLPDPDQAASLVTARTRAISLVSPSNPGGVEYPAELIRAFYDLARTRGIALILDETYRDFLSHGAAPHDLFADPDWDDTLIQLYSFSKAYRLTGHRVGAITTSAARLAEVEKFIDTVTICPSRIGQMGALYGMRNLSQWVAGERAEILARRAAMAEGFEALDGWNLHGLGGFFAWTSCDLAENSVDLARAMLDQQNLLALPGSMFLPTGDPAGKNTLRIAFANVDREGIAEMFARLKNLTL